MARRFSLFFLLSLSLSPCGCGVAVAHPPSHQSCSLSFSFARAHVLTLIPLQLGSTTPPITDRRMQDWPVMDWKTATAISVACESFFSSLVFSCCLISERSHRHAFFFSLSHLSTSSPLLSLTSFLSLSHLPPFALKNSRKRIQIEQTSAASSGASAS